MLKYHQNYKPGEKIIFMNKKRKKQICIDCDEVTRDYYPMSTNRGKIYRCANCYELWLTRSTRREISFKDIEKQ